MKTIKFYSTTGKYGCFSNFAPYSVKLDGKKWPTSEHYFQAQKFMDADYQEKIRKANTPNRAASLGRSRKVPIRRDWESVKVNVMQEVVTAKFSQHKDLASILISTVDEDLVEHTNNDSFWGDGGDGHGKNMLGVILMKVRALLMKKLQ